MAATEAQKKASKKYIENNLESLYTRVPKGQKDKIRAHATAMGESINEFVCRAINETMKQDLR